MGKCCALTHHGFQCQNDAAETVAGVGLCTRHAGWAYGNGWLNVRTPRGEPNTYYKPSHQIKRAELIPDAYELRPVRGS